MGNGWYGADIINLKSSYSTVMTLNIMISLRKCE